MRTDLKKTVMTGVVRGGEWEYRDRVYVDDDNLESAAWDFRGRRVRVTIEELEYEEVKP